MWSLFRRGTRPARPHRTPPPSYRPHLEVLEDRLCPSGGLLDTSFGTGGQVSLPTATNNASQTVAIQPDGKIVSVGTVNASGTQQQEIAIVRLNPDGTLDKTFNGTGVVALKLGVNADAGSVAIQPDGKILVGGNEYPTKKSFQGYADSEIVIARLNTNGTLDTTFANNGIFTWNRLPSQDSAGALTVLTNPDGSFSIFAIAGSNNINNNDVIFKLKANGSMDTSFGTNGAVTLSPLQYTQLNDMTFLPIPTPTDPYGGDLIVSGSTWGKSTGLLFAVNPTYGTLDKSLFNGQGWLAVTDPAGDQFTFNAVAVQGDNVVVGGNEFIANQGSYAMLARFNLTTGAPDTTFANNGYYVMSTPGGSFINLAVEPDGSLIAEGQIVNNNLTVVHFTNGQLDPTFGNNGFEVITGIQGFGLAIDTTADGHNGSIVVSGYNQTGQRMAYFARLTSPIQQP